MVANFDDLNNNYFEEMYLSEEQVKKRREMAEALLGMMRWFYEMFLLGVEPEYMKQQLAVEYLAIIGTVGGFVDDSLTNYSQKLADEIVDNTVKHSDDEYYLSQQRAVYVAENEANTYHNYTEYQEAVTGEKKYKRWLGILDDKQRETHKEVTGDVIPIDNLFQVGNAQMRYPKDFEMANGYPEEIVNCRCSVEYL